ncbi:MAG TPA: helix-turn-helix transcriptional regulator [Verrucomicrobiae bacterium]|nr:helix-turn-helix transcriptional regulator [Verrucomicrobiae bacterium]
MDNQMEQDSQPEKYKRIFAQRLAEECQARHWPEDQWQKRLKEITGASQATISRWLNGESIPHPLARQALSKAFDKLDSYWLGGKTDLEIQTDTEAKAMELQERPYEDLQREPDAKALRLPDYRVFAASELKRMLTHLTERLIDTPAPRAAPILDQIEMIAVTLRAKLREAPAPRREKALTPAQGSGVHSSP